MSYQQAILDARRRLYGLDFDAAVALLDDLVQWANDIDDALLRLPRGTPGRVALERLARQVHEAGDALGERLVGLVQTRRQLTFDAILGIWRQAQAAEQAFIGRRVAIDMAGAWSGIGGRSFKTLLPEVAADGAREVNAVIRQALLRGESPVTLATSLRPYVLGASELPRNLQTAEARGLARQVRHRAERIAFTEMHLARAEAEVQHFLQDPYVYAVRWTRAPDRGSQRKPDVCDALATGNYYGLGVGVYPLSKVPPIPHPWCRCEREPLEKMRPVEVRPEGVYAPEALMRVRDPRVREVTEGLLVLVNRARLTARAS